MPCWPVPFGFATSDSDISDTLRPYALSKAALGCAICSNKAPSFRAVMWTGPSSAVVRRFEESCFPSILYSSGASIVTSENLKLAAARARVFSFLAVKADIDREGGILITDCRGIFRCAWNGQRRRQRSGGGVQTGLDKEGRLPDYENKYKDHQTQQQQ